MFIVLVIFIVAGTFHVSIHQFLLGGAKPHQPWPQRQHTEHFISDVSGSDMEEAVSRWYNGSACSGRGEQFVGDRPLFAPCRPDLPQGVATWGRYPYVSPPHQFMNNSQNPCWMDKGHVRCVPYFYLIGVSKSGTSDLFYRLTSHPQAVRTVKEPHFFDRKRYTNKRKFEDYVNQYNKLGTVIEKDIGSRGYSRVVAGDATPSYFYDNYNWQQYSGNEGCSEPRVVLANHIVHLNPAVRLVVIIRHPVNRLYSRYLFDYGRSPLFNWRNPPSPQQFHSFVVDGLRQYMDCFQRWSLRHCVYDRMLLLKTASENLYPVLLEDWLRVVPRDQIIFLRFEDYKQDTAAHLQRVFDFLGMDKISELNLKNIVWQDIRNQGHLSKSTGPMLPETWRLLEQFYRPFIRRLAAMLGDRKFLWDDVDLHPHKPAP
ncbi:hypothetical protein ACOMHN_043364 [Nucella lapillus]